MMQILFVLAFVYLFGVRLVIGSILFNMMICDQ